MDVTLTKWGNSIGIRLPMAIIKMLNLHNGDKVHLELLDRKVTIEPVKSNRETIKQALVNFDANQLEKIELEELDSETWHV